MARCPYLECQNCENCKYWDYDPNKESYQCNHPEKEMDDEKRQDWRKIASYIRECGYDWTYEKLKYIYINYYLRNKYCPFTFLDIISNFTVQCMRLFESNIPIDGTQTARFSHESS